MRKLPIKFSFAGFNFPRYIPELSSSKYDRRTSRSVYYHAPEPLNGTHPGKGFYLGDAGSPGRWLWCDAILGDKIKYRGWYTDDYCSDTIRGIVVRLTHDRCLAGWSMGEDMCSEVDGRIYTNERAAAWAADSMAERAAEQEREYQEEERRREEEEEARRVLCEGGDEEETAGY